MEIYFVPFEEQIIVYRPLVPLAFVVNQAMARYLEDRLAGRRGPHGGEADRFLDAVGFWEPDPEAPPAWVPGGEHRPTQAVLLMTSACNLRCTYCYAHGGEGPVRQMSWPLARQVIDAVHANARATGAGRFGVTFHGGGEPTANWDVLTRAVRYARERDRSCELTLSSNGVLSPERREFLLEHFTGLSLSFDGLREVQDRQRPTAGGGGSFDQVMETIRDLDAAGFPYGVRVTVTPENFATLARSVEFLCTQTRCGVIQVEPAFSGTRGEHLDPDRLLSEAFICAFTAAMDVAARHGRPFFYSGARPWLVGGQFCRAARDALVVTPDGALVGCFEIHDTSHPLTEQFLLGRITLPEEAGASSRRLGLPLVNQAAPSGVAVDRDALAAFAARDRDWRDDCRSCFCYWHCAGDCTTRRGQARELDRGRCHVNREITREVLARYIEAGDGVWRGDNGFAAEVPGWAAAGLDGGG